MGCRVGRLPTEPRLGNRGSETVGTSARPEPVVPEAGLGWARGQEVTATWLGLA